MRQRIPARLRFEIEARDGAARTGVIAHGARARSRRRPSSRWPPRGRCAALEAREVAELGYEMVLGNTYHLFISPGPERIAARRRAARVHGLGAGDHHRLRRLPGVLARPRRRRQRDQGARRRAAAGGARSRSPRRGCAFQLLSRRLRRCSSRPRTRWQVQAALGSDIALVFDECTPVPRRPRVHGALDRAHAPLARSLPRLARAARALSARRCSGSSRAASTRTCGANRRRRSPRPGWTGSRSAAPSAATRRRCASVLGDDGAAAARGGAKAPARHRRGRRPARRHRPRHRRLRLRGPDPARPATALPSAPSPTTASASTCAKARLRGRPQPDRRRLPLPGLPAATTATTSATCPAPRS